MSECHNSSLTDSVEQDTSDATVANHPMSRACVKTIIQQVDDKDKQALMLQRQLDDALQRAIDRVRSVGRRITPNMVALARAKASTVTSDTMQEQEAHDVLIREVAIADALKQAEDNGVNVPRDFQGNVSGALSAARLAACNVGVPDYETMLASAFRALNHKSCSYVLAVTTCTQAGLDLILSMSSLGGDCFEIRVARDKTVADVIALLRQECASRWPAPPGKLVEVKLVGPAGTLLHFSKTIADALEYETEAAAVDDELGTFYPLAVLIGQQWKELGLDGPTRWKHLREKDFMNLFSMSKATFEKLPSWKQIPLRRKHGLF